MPITAIDKSNHDTLRIAAVNYLLAGDHRNALLYARAALGVWEALPQSAGNGASQASFRTEMEALIRQIKESQTEAAATSDQRRFIYTRTRHPT